MRSILAAFCSGVALVSRRGETRMVGESSQKTWFITRVAASDQRLKAMPSGSVSGNKTTLCPRSGRNFSTCTSPSPPAASHTYSGYTSDKINAVFSASTTQTSPPATASKCVPKKQCDVSWGLLGKGSRCRRRVETHVG